MQSEKVTNLLDLARAECRVLELAVDLDDGVRLPSIGRVGGAGRSWNIFAKFLRDVSIVLEVQVSVDALVNLVVDLSAFALGISRLVQVGSHDGMPRLCDELVRRSVVATDNSQGDSYRVMRRIGKR